MGIIIFFLLCSQAIGENDSAVEQDFAAASDYRRQMRHEDAAEVYQRLLRSPTLSQQSRLRAHIALAETLEAVPGRGEQARSAYEKIRDTYPELPEGIQAAYRLGCLYDSILLPGTSRSRDKAIEQFAYVVRRSPTSEMVHLKARMNLGNLASEVKEFDGADRHFRMIYETGTALLTEREAAGTSDPQSEGGAEGEADELTYMVERAAVHMAENCVRGTLADSLRALSLLRNRYPRDTRIEMLATRTGRKIVAVFEKEIQLAAAEQIASPEFAAPSEPDAQRSTMPVRSDETLAQADESPSSSVGPSSEAPPATVRGTGTNWAALSAAMAVVVLAAILVARHVSRRRMQTKGNHSP